MNKFLFLNIMNNTGSTLLYNLLATCKNSVPLKREGQSYAGFFFNEYELRCPRLFSFEKERIADPSNYNYEKIKSAWTIEWKRSPKYQESGKVLLQKSPSDVYRYDILKDIFPESNILIMVRDPYTTIEGTIRRGLQLHYNQTSFPYTIQNASAHWILCIRKQIELIQKHKLNWFTYEDLFDSTEIIESRIKLMFPELYDFKIRRNDLLSSIYGTVLETKIANRNKAQAKNLSEEQIQEISMYLEYAKDELAFFGYKLR